MDLETFSKFGLPVEDQFGRPVNYFPENSDNDGTFETFGKSLVRGFLTVGKGLVGTVEEAAELIPGVEEENWLTKVRANIAAEEERFAVTPDNTMEWGANILGQALPYMGSALVAGMYAGPIGAASIAFSVEGQEAYDEAKKRGASETKANLERGVVGTINAAIEALQISKILKFADKGKFTFKAFKKAVQTKAWGKLGELGAEFGKEAILNSIEEGFEEFLQQGVQFAAPALIEGKQTLPLREDGTIDTRAILMNMGEAALAGAVISPLLGTAKAFIPVMAAPSVENFANIRKAIDNSPQSEEWKIARHRELDLQIEQMTGEEVAGKESGYRNLLNWIDSRANDLADFRPEHEQTISERRGAKKKEAAQFLEDNKEAVANGEMSPEELAVGYKTIMQGSLTPEFNMEMSRDQYETFLEAVFNTYDPKSFQVDEAIAAFHKLFYEHKLPERSEIESLEPVLGKSIVNKILGIQEKVRRRQMTFSQKVAETFFEFINFPRAVLASWDVSFVGRQGFFMAFKDPKLWKQSVASSWRAYLSPEYAAFQDMEIRSHPMFDYVKNTLKMPYHEPGTATSDEHFMSKYAKVIPGVRASERAYVTAANSLRYKYMYKYLENSYGTGRTLADHKQMASIIAHLTGWGDMKSLVRLKNSLNIFFFSPRLLQARIQSLTDLNPIEIVKGKPHLRFSPAQRTLLGIWVKAVGTGVGVLYLLSLIKGVKVEKDPRSTDFGKIQIGDTRIDFWSGYSQIARLIAQTMMGERKTQGGNITDVERKDIIMRFLQTKLSPGAGLAVDMYRGTDFKGKILQPTGEDVSEQFLSRTVPLFIQDMYELVKYQKSGTVTALAGASAFHGIGVLTYPETKSSQSLQYKNAKSQEYFGAKWDELGPISQKMLRLTEPMIDEMDRQADQEKLNKQVNARFLKEIRTSERQIRRALPREMRDELDKLLVNVGGLSRKVGSDWYLNKQRYLEYKAKVIKSIKEQIPVWLSMNLPPQIKRAFIEDTIDNIKEFVRQEIIIKANMKDFVRM